MLGTGEQKMEILNAEQIKKALECCSPSGKHCTECVYFYRAVDDICAPYLMADALALITSQEQRIKELTEENERLIADTIKEFAKRAKASLDTFGEQHHYQCKRIDQIAKEMLEGEK